MALSHVGTTTWNISTASVTPTLPAGWQPGDLAIITVQSKHEDAAIGAVSGWTGTDDNGTDLLGFTAAQGTGVDQGDTRTRGLLRILQAGDTLPTLTPNPNNVSGAKCSVYRVASGKAFSIVGVVGTDATSGTPLSLPAGSTLGLTAGDILHCDLVLNGDAPVFGTTTATATGATFGAYTSNVADVGSAVGQDIRFRSGRFAVTAGTATGNLTVSTDLTGTTTTANGTGLLLRLREVDPPAGVEVPGTLVASTPVVTSSITGTTTVPASSGSITANVPLVTASISGDAEPPTWAGTITASTPLVTAAISGTTTTPSYAGTLEADLPLLTASITGDSEPPTWAGTLQADLPLLTASISGDAEAPSWAGTLEADLPLVTSALVGDSEGPTWGATLVADLPLVTAAIVGEVTLPLGSGILVADLPLVTATIVGDSEVPSYSGTLVVDLPLLTSELLGTTDAPDVVLVIRNITEHVRVVAIMEHVRTVRITQEELVNLPRHSVKDWSLTIVTEPPVAPDDWELSLDGKVTWHRAIVDPENAARSRWTLAGPDAELPLPDGAIVVPDDIEPSLRYIGDRERLYEGAPKVFVTG